MMRYAEIRRTDRLPDRLQLEVGDVLLVEATGFVVIEPASPKDRPVRFLGPLVEAALALNDTLIAPSAFPGVIILAARRAGETTVDIFRATQPGSAPDKHRLRISISGNEAGED